MNLKTEKKEIILRPTTRKIVKMTKENNAKNLNEYFFRIVNEGDIDGLGQIIYALAEIEGSTEKPFKNVDEVFDFLDDLRVENNTAYGDIFTQLGEFINDMGFFTKKMTKEELEAKMSDTLSGVDLNQVIKDSLGKAVTDIAIDEFSGYKA